MNTPLQDNPTPRIAELEARALDLQRELAQVQAKLAELKQGQSPATGREVPLAPAWDAPIPVSSPPGSLPADVESAPETRIYLQSLQPYHALRNKWQLGSGLENALTPAIHMPESPTDSSIASDLRLFGLLSDGRAWEKTIPFALIARETGVILGRAPEQPEYTIDDDSVSRNHLELRLDEYGLVVSDLQSTNGTAVNGARLTPYDNNRQLADGDTLSLGSVQLQVEFL